MHIHVCKVYCRQYVPVSSFQINILSVFKTSFTQLQALYVSVNIKKNHCRRTVRVSTLNFTEVIVYDELSMWLENKKYKNSVFEWSRFKGVFVYFEPFFIVSLLSGLFAHKALSTAFNLVYRSPV